MEAAFGFGIDGPRGGDCKARLDKRLGEGIPRAVGFVRKHHRHDTIRLQDAPAFLENRSHALLIIGAGFGLSALFALESRCVGGGFTILIRKPRGKHLGIQQTCRSLQPDVEEVGKLSVHDVVIVGRVDDNAIDA